MSKSDISFNMDYSKYYLKNYYKYHHDEDMEDYEEEYEVLDDQPISSDSSTQSDNVEQSEIQPIRSESKKYYARGVEIEVVPQLTSVVDTNYRINEEDVIIDVEPQIYDRYDNKRKGWIMTLAIVACLLITIVIGDFVTNGALLNGITSLYKGADMPKTNYYLLVLKETSSYQQARVYSDQMRLQGAGGYILKSDDNYLIIGDVYDDLDEANTVVDKNSGSTLLNYTIDSVDYESVLTGGSELMISMGGYSVSIIEQLSIIGESLTKSEIDKSQALEKIQTINDNLKLKYEELQEEALNSNYNIKLLMADIDTTLGLLENLVSDSSLRPNLLCDIRYTKTQMTLNYYLMTQKMSQTEE